MDTMAHVKRVTLVVDEATQQSIGVAWVKFLSRHEAQTVMDRPDPIVIDGQTCTLSWAKRDASSSSGSHHHHRSSSSSSSSSRHISSSALQEQIDWAAASAQKRANAAAEGGVGQGPPGYIYDASTGYYKDPNGAVYYDPKTLLFYNAVTALYYRWDPQANSYQVVDVQQQQQQQQQPQQQQQQQSQQEQPTGQQPSAQQETTERAQTPAPKAKAKSTAPASIPVKFSILGKKQSKDMERWNQKKTELVAADDDAGVRHGAVAIRPLTKTAKAVVQDGATGADIDQRQQQQAASNAGGTRTRMYISLEKLACLLCQRKFKDAATLAKHELRSEMHKANLALDEYAQVQRLERSAASLGIDLLPASGGAPAVVRRKRHHHQQQQQQQAPNDMKGFDRGHIRAPDSLIRGTASGPTSGGPGPLDETNVGNRLLQSMGWKVGEGLGRNGTGMTENITAHQNVERAGLGCAPVAAPEITAGDSRRAIAAKYALARYQDGRRDGHGANLTSDDLARLFVHSLSQQTSAATHDQDVADLLQRMVALDPRAVTLASMSMIVSYASKYEFRQMALFRPVLPVVCRVIQQADLMGVDQRYLSTLAHSLTRFIMAGHALPDMFHTVLPALASAAHHRIDQIDEVGLGLLAWSYARVDPRPDLMAAIARSAAARIASFPSSSLSIMLWAFARVDSTNDCTDDVFREAAREVIARLAADRQCMTPQQLSNIVWAFAKAGRVQTDLFVAVGAALVGRIGQCAPASIANTVWAYAAARLTNKALFDGMARQALRRMG
ncbi:hypothetical protein PBRA_009542, partial [Plasmodiophora brassicae]